MEEGGFISLVIVLMMPAVGTNADLILLIGSTRPKFDVRLTS